MRTLTPHALELVFLDLPGIPGPVADSGHPLRLRASARATGLIGDALVRLAQGQALDLALEEEARPGADATLRVHADKTGSLVACACALGAAPESAGDLAAFGEHLGIAFQIVDDVLGLWGDPAVTAKPAGADLTARKKPHGTGARAVSEAAACAHERMALDALARVCPSSYQAGGDLRALAAFVVGRAY
ncbi:polyprenyl synthetase family protein [Streptomyces goshikiensis]|uniref:polyprenyl synthetase family protein n=1 Tax=Streptomyces goshikiensis TaxID=1942 RepID=UPI0037B3F573